jgi:ketol-acid reductoisomerase
LAFEAFMTIRYAVQSFRQKGRSLVADQQQPARSSEAAIAMAERMSMTRDGVVAFSQEIDVETDCYDEPVILFRKGVLPAELTE